MSSNYQSSFVDLGPDCLFLECERWSGFSSEQGDLDVKCMSSICVVVWLNSAPASIQAKMSGKAQARRELAHPLGCDVMV